jgi:hypothetical protein
VIDSIGCCARAAKGQVMAMLLRIKSRRRIAFPKAQDHANVGFHAADQIRKLRPAEWGETANLHCKNLELSMSLMGQKRT